MKILGRVEVGLGMKLLIDVQCNLKATRRDWLYDFAQCNSNHCKITSAMS